VNAPACDEQPNQNFRSISEGLNYLNSGWVGTILHQHDLNKNTTTLKGIVRFSQTISSNHQVHIVVDRDSNQIRSVQCDCIASEGKCCSHSAGLAFKVNEAYKKGYLGIACTDQACMWNRSTLKNVLPDTIENMQGSKQKSTTNNVLAFDTDDDMRIHLTTPHMKKLAAIPGTILNHMLIAKPPKLPATTNNPVATHGHHSEELNCIPCRETYKKYVQVTAVTASTLAANTTNQNSALWTSQRKVRITSSSASSVPKRPDTDPSKWIKNHMHPTFSGNAATRHGHFCEQTARTHFEKETGNHVIMTGLVVKPEESWLGASLDGIVDDDTILEIKCPTAKKLSKFGGTVRGLIESGSYDVKISKEDNTYCLKETTASSGYYYQVQVAMFCSGRRKCKFMVFASNLDNFQLLQIYCIGQCR